jgi:hypothetical protein
MYRTLKERFSILLRLSIKYLSYLIDVSRLQFVPARSNLIVSNLEDNKDFGERTSIRRYFIQYETRIKYSAAYRKIALNLITHSTNLSSTYTVRWKMFQLVKIIVQ